MHRREVTTCITVSSLLGRNTYKDEMSEGNVVAREIETMEV